MTSDSALSIADDKREQPTVATSLSAAELRFLHRQRRNWCLAQLGEWNLADKDNFNFKSWATGEHPPSSEELWFGVTYEYARESRTLRSLLALSLANDDEDRKPRKRHLNPPWLKERDAGARGVQYGRHMSPRSFRGISEYDAEKRLGSAWAPLRTLALPLVRNVPFARLSEADRKEAWLSWKFKLPSYFMHFASVDADFEQHRNKASGHETLFSWWGVNQDQIAPRPKPRAARRDGPRHQQRTDQLKARQNVESLCVRLNWNESDSELERCFARFIRKYRPCPEPLEPHLRPLALLDALSALRLTKCAPTRETAFRQLAAVALSKVAAPDSFHPGNWTTTLQRAEALFTEHFALRDEKADNHPGRKRPARRI